VTTCSFLLSKTFFKISFQKFGRIKKLNSSLHPQKQNMQRRQSDINLKNWFSPIDGHTSCGACYAEE
jgi:hypothetical protein